MANKKDSLGDRMKSNYENRSKTSLTRRCPVIIRLDGKAFHTFTKHFNRPYDEIFHAAMNITLRKLCENIQGCKFGYTQSDEISLLLTDFDSLTTDAWFDYEVQKICSVSASMATLYFNKALNEIISVEIKENGVSTYLSKLHTAAEKGAMFDARCFNIPEEEVVNYFIWRQQDATRNAIQMLGQTYFSHKELDKKTCNMIQEMLWQEKGINFNDYPVEFKRGIGCVKESCEIEKAHGIKITRSNWVIDKQIPIFSQYRDYIENLFISRKN